MDAIIELIAGPNGDGIETLNILVKLCNNVLTQPENEKFRKIRKSNPAIYSNIVIRPGALELLSAFGFEQDMLESDFLSMAMDAHLQPEILFALQEAVKQCGIKAQRAQIAKVAAETEKRRQEFEKQKAIKDKELNELRRKMEEDRQNRQEKKEIRSEKTSVAVKRDFGSQAVGFKECGVDLNAKRG